jgi:WD40 repeat protein
MKLFCAATWLLCVVASLVNLHAAEEKPLPPPVLPKAWNKAKMDVARVAITADGKRIAAMTEGWAPEIVVYNRHTAKEVRRFGGKFLQASSLFAITPDGKRLLVERQGSANPRFAPGRYEVVVWEIATGKLLRRIDLRRGQGGKTGLFGHGSAASDKVLVVAGSDEVATVYDLATGKVRGDIRGKHRPKMLALSQNGKWLLTAGKDDTLCVWDVEKRELLHTLYEHTKRVNAVAISADGTWCASMTSDRRVWIFDRAKGEERARANTLFTNGSEELLRFTPDGKTLIGTGDGAHHGLVVWDWQKCREIRGGYPPEGVTVLSDGNEKRWHVALISDSSMAADGTLLTLGPLGLHVWEFASGVHGAGGGR